MIKKLKVGDRWSGCEKAPFGDDHESYAETELREAAEAWINAEEADCNTDDVCDTLSGLHMDRLLVCTLAPKTDEVLGGAGPSQQYAL